MQQIKEPRTKALASLSNLEEVSSPRLSCLIHLFAPREQTAFLQLEEGWPIKFRPIPILILQLLEAGDLRFVEVRLVSSDPTDHLMQESHRAYSESLDCFVAHSKIYF